MSSRKSSIFYFAAGAASFGTASLLYSYVTNTKPKQKVFPSPLDTLTSNGLPADVQSLPYPPVDFLPGARDMRTPYGSIRIYEFGPAESTRRVLFLHGISTPSVALADMAKELAAKGCRVLLLDLFGRGFSEGPRDGIPYDNRLYASQILLSLASSDVSWTGAGRGFSIVGYSLGGGLAADFTSWFPQLVDDLVLIAPGGLIRTIHINWKSKIVYSGMLPEWLLRWLVAKRLRSDPNVQTKTSRKDDDVSVEVADTSHAKRGTQEESQPIDAEAVVNWQIDNNPGFTNSFVSSIRHGPVHKQHCRWALIAARLDAQRDAKGNDAESQILQREGLRSNKILMFLGGSDAVVRPDEVAPDSIAVLGDENLEVKIVEGAGHELPITRAKEMAQDIWDFWERRGGALS